MYLSIKRMITSMSRLSSVAAVALLAASSAFPYSVLTHEAIIDSAWDISIKGVLLKRFPKGTAEELIEAHAYAYGGHHSGYGVLPIRFSSSPIYCITFAAETLWST